MQCRLSALWQPPGRSPIPLRIAPVAEMDTPSVKKPFKTDWATRRLRAMVSKSNEFMSMLFEHGTGRFLYQWWKWRSPCSIKLSTYKTRKKKEKHLNRTMTHNETTLNFNMPVLAMFWLKVNKRGQFWSHYESTRECMRKYQQILLEESYFVFPQDYMCVSRFPEWDSDSAVQYDSTMPLLPLLL